ncbi:Quinate/shikimate 5-dehydrogenase/glutamyl-tRNA reductase [Penicillium cf. griseofulvum]|uniref:Quinate/shikimate 5-dehydrogenase/glutamyl-tRNA reductase n=1 Tax=Penicillium cf. griseofulvum TaxID=2972120 RepID=A0A9W9MUE3_9EURO|nr:Quinate/shikimate 5-dehydrogenase/glutamyl-tRNA reductase [Penicillium cf. griseofulvum]KAJ5445764.1 Quinate/shikimate 5-dehydrogenase/glutamyl-tRNA reductase [Penicillium cf. griseofulvum]KAJ5447486.1 Quinate/shikimate 5-dehydrogenase/glutamyl-tRNA reductase [Penicillium cf. griseofulvum]
MDLLKQSYAHGSSPLPPNAAATQYHVYLFGGNISKSLSPLLHSILFRASSASWTFHLTETTDSSVFRNQLDDTTCIGTTITMPNKVSFGRLLDDLTDEARMIGAVNTSFIRLDNYGQRRHIGTNTDCIGIRDSILYRMPDAAITAKGRPSMVIGGGGAARSAIFALWRWFGSTKIYIANRLKSEVDALTIFFQSTAPDITFKYLATVEQAATCETPYIVIGTIPNDIPREAGEITCRQICDTILHRKDKGIVLDMCYLPSPVTYLYTNGNGNGWTVIPGTEVLVRVCIAQQILWLEKDVSNQGVDDAMLAIWKAVNQGQSGPKASKI